MALTYDDLKDIQKQYNQSQQSSSSQSSSNKASSSNKTSSSSSGGSSSAKANFESVAESLTPVKIVQNNVKNNFIPTVSTIKPTSSLSKSSSGSSYNYFSDGYDLGDVTKTFLTGVFKAANNSFGDGKYNVGDVTKTILGGVKSAVTAVTAPLVTAKTNAQNTSNSFVKNTLTKYSTMSYSQLDKEYSRIEKEVEYIKSTYGNKLTNILTKASSYLTGATGQSSYAVYAQSKAMAEKLDDLVKELEVVNVLRKEKAAEELLGNLTDEQLKMLDYIAEGEALEDSAVFSILAPQGGMDSATYNEVTEAGRQAGKKAREELIEQLKTLNPEMSIDELNEYVDDMVEIRESQVNASNKSSLDAELSEFATENPVSAFALSRISNFIGGFTGLAELYLQRENEYGLDVNAPGFSFTNSANKIDEQVQLDHDWKIGEVDAFDLFYNIGTGIVDNLARVFASGGNATVAGSMMFTQVTSQSIIEGKKQGYSDAKALTMGLLEGTFEALTEKLALEKIFGDKGGTLRSIAKAVVAEGGEEVSSNWLNRIADLFANGNHSELKSLYQSYIEQGYSKAKALANVALSIIGEDVEAFVIGGASGAALGGLNALSNKGSAVTLDEKAQSVVDNLTQAYVDNQKNSGNTVTAKQEASFRNDLTNQALKGYLDTETIESIFGGEDYEAYKAAKDKVDNGINQGKELLQNLRNVVKNLSDEAQQSEIENRIQQTKEIIEKLSNDKNVADLKTKLGQKVYDIVKDSQLVESYNEIARKEESFKADFETVKGLKNEAAARASLENAVKSGADNTNRMHDFVDLTVKISGDTGLIAEYKTGDEIRQELIDQKTREISKLESVSADKRTKKQSNEIKELKTLLAKIKDGSITVNGYISGNRIIFNTDSNDSLSKIAGHEITHSFESSKKLHDDLKEVMFTYAEMMGEDIEGEIVKRKALYTGDMKADAENELLADLVGKYLFGDYEFIKNLSVNNKSLFKRLWGEIKYLCRLATAGSKEARQLEKVKHQFEKAYKEASEKGAKVEGRKHSIVEIVDQNNKSYGIGVKLDSTLLDELNPKERVTMVKEHVKELGGEVFSAYDKNGNSVNITIAKSSARFKNNKGKSIPVNKDLTSKYINNEVKQEAIVLVDELVITSKYDNSKTPLYPHDWLDDNGKNDWEYWITYIQDKNNTVWEATLNIANTSNGEKILYDIYPINIAGQSVKSDTSAANNIISQNSKKSSDSSDKSYSFSSTANSFFGDPELTADEFRSMDYKKSEGYKSYIDMCVNNYRQSRADFNEADAKASIEKQIDGIVKVALASKDAGYDIFDDPKRKNSKDSKGRSLFTSLEPNSDYFTSNDISTTCDKRQNFAEIYDAIVKREDELNVPANKRFFNNIDNYFFIHKVLADKGLTQPCRQCYVESMRKNLAPMARNFIKLVSEKDVNNKSNDQLYHPRGKKKGQLKSNNAELRKNVIRILEEHPEYGLKVDDITVEMLTTADGLATMRISQPYLYEAFNSFYGQSKPKMPKGATPYRFGELTALLTKDDGTINERLVNQINSTGGFRLQSYSDFQVLNFTDVLQVLFEAGTLGLSGHAYTKVPLFLDATDGTNLKRNISIFMYKDGNEWKIDRNDSFPYQLSEIYDIVNGDSTGNTSIVAVSQNDDMSAWIMANDYVGYGIPFHKSGAKMSTVRDTDVKTDDGRIVKGYSGIKDHTRQQAEVWASTSDNHKALTKVSKGINIYSFWDFENKSNKSKNELIKDNLKKYIDACDDAGYLPKFRAYVINNDAILNKTLQYGKELGFLSVDATVDDISFEYKGYRIPYGYYKFLGDFGMFTPDGKASPAQTLSLESYDFDKAVKMFNDAESLRRNEILQQFANGEERAKYRDSDLTAGELEDVVRKKRNEVVDSIVAPVKASLSSAGSESFLAPTSSGEVTGANFKNVTSDNAESEADNLRKAEELRLTLAASPHFTRYAEKAYTTLDSKKSDLRARFESERAELEANKERVKDKDTFVRNEAFALYVELRNLKKGIKASETLGYLLDHGYDWAELKSTLLKVSRNPDIRLNPDSAIESIVRETIDMEYESISSLSVEDLEADYNRQIQRLEIITKQQIDNFLDRLVRDSQSKRRYENIIGESQVGTKSPVNNKGGIWNEFVRNFVSKGAVFETTALKSGNRALEDKYKMWKDRSSAKAEYFMKNGKGDVPSLKSIVDKVNKSGLGKEFDLYLKHRHNISRMYFDKPIFGYDVSAEASQKEAARLQKMHPEFKEWVKEIYKYNDYLLNMSVDGGLVSAEFAAELQKKYPNYVPIERIGDVSVGDTGDNVSVNSVIKTATGGDSDTENILKVMAKRTTQVFKAVDKNAFGVELMKTLGDNGSVSDSDQFDILGDLTEADDSLLNADKKGNNPTFSAFVDGSRVTFPISKEMYEALQPVKEAWAREIKALSIPSKLHKKLITEYNLAFTLRNAPKDAQEVIFNSKHAAKTYANMPVAFVELISRGDYAKEYWENGGKSSSYFDNRENDFIKDKNAFMKVLGFLPDRVSAINDFVESVPRLAEYIASRKKGESIEASMLDAARVTTDFSDGGDITKFFNRNGATFLNASVQGAAQHIRNFREAKADGAVAMLKLVSKYALSGLPVLLFNYLMWDDDEDYEDLSEYIKDNYYVIAKYGDRQFVRIPKGRTAAVIQEVTEQVAKLIRDDDTDWDDITSAFKAVKESFLDNIAPNNPITDNVIAPLWQAANNKAWYGEEIIPSSLKDVPSIEQFDESTDSISKWLGEKTGISPYKINYVLNQYSGFIGDIFLPMLTPEAERGDSSLTGNLLAPLIDQFVADGVIKNRNPSDFYALKSELNGKAVSVNATAEDKVRYTYIYYASLELGELYNQRREIQNSDLPDDEKFKQVREVQDKINELAKYALETYDNVEVDGNFATANGTPYKYVSDKDKWYTLYDNEVEDMNKAMETLGITAGEYWSNKDVYDAKADNPAEYAFAVSVMGDFSSYKVMRSGLYDIRADKDENGKAISGSAKEKKREYIWSLDIDEDAKRLLFRSQYDSYNDYNFEICDYVNRLDIPLEEKIMVLKFANFVVDADGHVSW